MGSFYIIPDKFVDRERLIVYSPNQEEDAMTKGTWGAERPGHKYISRRPKPGGGFEYEYADEDKKDRPSKPRAHEPEGYTPPTERLSDGSALPKLMDLGDRLYHLQVPLGGRYEKDDTGFSLFDKQTWLRVASSATAEDPASMYRLRAILGKYKRQISGMVGLDAYYALGLYDATVKKQSGKLEQLARLTPRGDIILSVTGHISKTLGKEAFDKYREIGRKFGVKLRKDIHDQWENYIPSYAAAEFDEAGYREALAAIGIDMAPLPERPKAADAPPQGDEVTVQPKGQGTKLTTDDVIEQIKNRAVGNTIAIKVFTEGPHKGKVGFWSTFSQDFNFIMGNKSTGPEALSGIIETQKDLGWVRLTNSPRLYREALEKLRKKLPNFTFVIDSNVTEWEGTHEASTSERQKPIPQLQKVINPEIQPFPFQNEAVRFFMDNDGNGLLGDEMGLGKTLQALAYAAATGKRALVVCPKVVRKNWLLEAKRFFPGHFDDVKELVSADLKASGMPDLSKVKIAAINYEILEKFMPAIKAAGFDLLIVDESHRMKNPKAKLTKHIQSIAKDIAHKILLSGTALKNKREELFTQLQLVKPGFVGQNELRSGMIGSLHHKLAQIYLARKKKDVVADMPPKLKQAVELDVANLGEIESTEGGSDLAEVTRIKHELAKAKAPVTAEFVKELLESSDSNVLVFTDSVPAAEAIKEKLGAVAVLHTGSQSTDAQDAARAHFDPLRRQEGDPVRVLVSTTAKGIGFNAQTADKVVFNDLPWTPADKHQAEDRAYRIGTKNTVNVYDIHAAGSAFDAATAQLLLTKEVLFRKLMDGEKLSPEEAAWAKNPIRPQDILAAMRGKKVGPTVAEVDAPATKTAAGDTIIPPTEPAEKIPEPPKAEPPPEPPKPERPKAAWQKEAEEREAARVAEQQRYEAFRVATVTKTGAAAARALDSVPEILKGHFKVLHATEATPMGATAELPKTKGQALQYWFRQRLKAKDPNVDARAQDSYAYSSAAGTLSLRHSWKGQEGVWTVEYTSQTDKVRDAMEPDDREAADKLYERFKAGEKAPEPDLAHNEKPKFVIPAVKPIEESKPKVEPETSATAHTGAGATPKEDTLERKVEAAGQPQQLLLFKALHEDTFVISDSDFDLCLSLADKLVDAGEFEDAIDLIKAATHKYLRRIPTGKPRPKWYYVYNITSKHHDPEVKEGEKVRIHSEGQAGHYEVEKVHPNGYVTLKHDETGQRLSMKAAHLHELFAEEHQPAIEAAQVRLKRTVEAAKVHGTEKQQEQARQALREHEERFSIKTPERIATQKAQGLSVLTRAAPTVENHIAAADAHIYAAGFGGEHAKLHLEMAKLHHEAAKLRSAQEATKKALTDPGVTFHVPGKTEAEKARAPALVVPKKGTWGGKREAKGAFFGDKRKAYLSLVTDEHRGDFTVADTAYWKWKDGKGPKPQPWKGGELDAVNHALGLEVTRRGFQVIDPRVSSLAEGWDRLVGLAKRWDSDKVMQAIETLREVPGLARMQLPEEAEKAHEARLVAEQEADAREQMGGEYEEARLDDAMTSFADQDQAFHPDEVEGEVDTSFDFGFNVEPEDEDPKESYKTKGPRAPTFKAWFGDWEHNPGEASKVVKKDGSPAEQHNMAPTPVYHGTAVGGFTHFDPAKASGYNIFGDGFYFTEDKEIATEYTKKDSDEHKWGAMHGLTDADGKPVTHLPAKWAQKVINNTAGYGGEHQEYADWDKQCLAAALKRAMEPEGVNVTTLLREYRNPSGPVLDGKGNVDQYEHHGSPIGLRSLVKRLAQDKVGTFKPDVAPPQVFEVYLNVRKPIDMDAPISREDFGDLAGYFHERERRKFGETPEEKEARAKMSPAERAEAGHPTSWKADNRLPFYTKNLNDNPVVRALGDDPYSKAFTYEDMIKAKRALREDKKDDGSPAYPIFHLSDADTLTWGDVHYMMTDSHWYQTPMGDFRKWAEKRGYDGISHTGGWNVGTKAHKVWIAWRPNQIKATENEGTFDPGTADIRKSMNQTNTFVIIPEKLEKAGEQAGHKYIRREGTPGNYRYFYADEKGGAFSMQVPVMGSLGPISADTMAEKVADLVRLPADVLDAMDKRLASYIKRLGETAPHGLHLWARAVATAMGKAAPKMTAIVPTPPPAAKEAGIPQKGKPQQLSLFLTPMAAEQKAPPPPVPATKPVDEAKDLAEKAIEVAETVAQPEDPPVAPEKGPEPQLAVKAKPEKKAKPKPKKAVERATKTTDEGGIQATGDHIWGSRFDLANIGRITDSKQLEGMTYDDALAIVTKKHCVPAHDLDTLKAAGMSPGAAHMALAIMTSIVAKPADSKEARAAYVDEVHRVMGALLNCKNKEDVRTMLREMYHEYYSAGKYKDVSKVPMDNDARDREIDRLRKENPNRDYRYRMDYGSYQYVIVTQNQRPFDSLGSRFTRFIAGKGKDRGEAEYEADRADGAPDGWEYLETRGQQKSEKAQAKSAKTQELRQKAGVSQAFSESEMAAGKMERKGHNVEVKDADPQRVKETFNLREVDYGQAGYMSQDDREWHTRQLEGAFHDFAEVLGIPKADVSFNGRLGVALGARGRGKHAAHYEPGRYVINITKLNGSGALAHEWGHALDNILALHYSGRGVGERAFLSETPNEAHWPPELKAAYQRVHDAMHKHPDPERAKREHREHIKKLQAEEAELVRKNNELVREHKTIAEKIPDDPPGRLQARITRLKEQRSEWFRELNDWSRRKGMKATQEIANRKYWIEQYDKKIKAAEAGEMTLTEADKARQDQIKLEIEELRIPINRARAAVSNAQRTDPTGSSYHKASKLLGEYWSRPTEMFARAFESYVQGKLDHGKRGNTYLTGGDKTKTTWHTRKEMPDGTQAQPYPQGEERDNIHRAMDEFVAVLRKTGDLQKALWALQQPLPRFVIRGGLA
jgi:superfamily II DNA or RNA helicase